MVKNLLANAGDAGDLRWIPGSGRPPEKEIVTHSSILAWRIPWTEKTGVLWPVGSQRAGHDLTQHACSTQALRTSISLKSDFLFLYISLIYTC